MNKKILNIIDDEFFVYSGNGTWFLRGDRSSEDSYAGVFAFDGHSGVARIYISFRVVVS